MKARILVPILLGMSLMLAGCHKKSPPLVATPAPPSPPDYFQQGEEYFASGKYAEAARAYDNFLRNNPPAENQDRALFRLAIAYAIPGSPIHNWQRALVLFKRVLSLFPKSPLALQADFILGLQAEVDKLRADVREREDRIKQLTTELEKLKKIDLQRRPTRPPN